MLVNGEYGTGRGNGGGYRATSPEHVKGTYRPAKQASRRRSAVYGGDTNGHIIKLEICYKQTLRRTRGSCLGRGSCCKRNARRSFRPYTNRIDNSRAQRNKDVPAASHKLRRSATELQGKKRPAY